MTRPRAPQTETLDQFQREWYRLSGEGKLSELDIGSVPDIYVRNQQLSDRRAPPSELRAEAERGHSARAPHAPLTLEAGRGVRGRDGVCEQREGALAAFRRSARCGVHQACPAAQSTRRRAASVPAAAAAPHPHPHPRPRRLKSMQSEIDKMQAVSDAAKSTWDKFRKERDFHRMHHKRVVQEKEKLIVDLRRLKSHYENYEPMLKMMRAKYEVAMKVRVRACAQPCAQLCAHS
jgi:hypothetical protein